MSLSHTASLHHTLLFICFFFSFWLHWLLLEHSFHCLELVRLIEVFACQGSYIAELHYINTYGSYLSPPPSTVLLPDLTQQVTTKPWVSRWVQVRYEKSHCVHTLEHFQILFINDFSIILCRNAKSSMPNPTGRLNTDVIWSYSVKTCKLYEYFFLQVLQLKV